MVALSDFDPSDEYGEDYFDEDCPSCHKYALDSLLYEQELYYADLEEEEIYREIIPGVTLDDEEILRDTWD